LLGNSGLDGTDLLPVPTTPPITPLNAIVAMRSALLAIPPGTAWLVATGALTNAALLFATFPEVIDHIKGLSIMGGAIGNNFTDAPMGTVKDGAGGEDVPRSGNITHFAEFNIYCDPEAARSIFSNPLLAGKTTLIPLDVTHQVFATQRIQNMVLHGQDKPLAGVPRLPSVVRRLFHDLLIFFAQTYADVFDLKAGPPLHDPVAVTVLLQDDANLPIKFDFGADQQGNEERWDVEIITVGEHSDVASEQGRVGATIARKAQPGAAGGVKIPRTLEVQKFWYVMGQCIASAEEFVATGEENTGTELVTNEFADFMSWT
jgi:uridine nucleosidase